MSVRAYLRLVLLLSLAGLLGFLGYLICRERDPLLPLAAAEKAYVQVGKANEDREAYREAVAGYDQAFILLENAYRRIEGANGLDPEKAKDVAGKILYLKSKVLRDKYYCLALAAGKPLAEATDSVTGENFRNIYAIPDSADQADAAGSLRGAAMHFLPGELDVQLDALRLTLMTQPISWDHVERIGKAILALKPDDSRAKYLLARVDFEQPDQRTHRPTPPEKRSRERVLVASRTIDEVKADPKFPVWRTDYLRASIHRWLMKNPVGDREKGQRDELKILDGLLLDPFNGALARMRKGQGFDNLGAWDSEGILGLYVMATEVAMEKARKKPGVSKDNGFVKPADSLAMQAVFVELLDFCAAKAKRNDPNFPRPLLMATLLNTMVSGQAMLALAYPKEWQQGLQQLRPLFKEEFDAERCDPTRVAQFAELLLREAQIVLRRGGMAEQAQELHAEAKKWLGDGLAFGNRHHFKNEQMLPLNVLAANVYFISGEKRDVVAPILEALHRIGLPQTMATALMIDGAFDEREGRLLLAKEKIERAVKIDGGDEEIRGHATLANIYMAMERPDYALLNLLHLKEIFNRYDDLADQEKEWLAVFLRSPQNYHALTVIASLENARRTIAVHLRKNPGTKTFPPDLVKEDENRVKGLFKRELASLTNNPAFIARTAWVHHLALTNRRKEAEDEWQALNINFPDRLELLSLKIELLERDAFESGDLQKRKALPTEVDRLILAFMKAHPADQSAQLYYATWLAHTRRTEPAVASLKAIVEGSSVTPEVRRTATAIMLTLESDLSPNALLRHLPRNPQIDRVLFDLGKNSINSKAEIRSALSRHESLGLTRIMQADDLYVSGEFAKAAQAFALALDHTRVRPFAEQGFLRSILALANRDPQAARTTIDGIYLEFPNEPTILIAYASVLLAQDNIGSATDDWELHRTMGSALNAWEQRLGGVNKDKSAAIALTRSEFWARANRFDLALGQAKRALNYDRQNPVALAACATLILDDPSQDPRPELQEYLIELERFAPNSVAVRRLLGRAAERSHQWNDAVRYFERNIAAAPKDRESYARLINVLDAQEETEEAAKWLKEWRAKLPNDSQAVSIEIRRLAQAKDIKRAIEVADRFLEQTQKIGIERAQKASDAKTKAKLIEDSRWLPQLELVRGFALGGALDEAERRILQMPKLYADSLPAQEMLADVYLKRKQWDKAEPILTALVDKNPRNLTLVNNLAQLLAVHTKNPSRAREVIRASMKTDATAMSVRATDRLPAEFLNTIGVVYTKLDNPAYGRELLQFFTTAALRFPNDPRVELYTGVGYELIGENERAADHYERAIKKAVHPSISTEQRDLLLTDAVAFRDRAQLKAKAQSR